MDTKSLIDQLNTLQRQMHALGHAAGVLSYDAETIAPPAASDARGETMGTLAKLEYELFINPRTDELLSSLEAQSSQMPAAIAREVELLRRRYHDTACIPVEEFAAFVRLTNKANDVWHTAKQRSDFALYQPYLEQLVEMSARFARLRAPQLQPYDQMLNDYEEGLTTDYLQGYFARLKDELVPLVHAIGQAKQPDTSFLKGPFPVDKQRELSRRVMALMQVDSDRCILGETEHPFTSGFNRWDVRVTTHYYEQELLSSLFSVIHECGHGLYELGIGEELQYSVLSNITSMGMHESQSRLYENMLGRSLPFADQLLPMLQELFPGSFKDVKDSMLHAALNVAKPDLIRVEADELTYSMHIMVRFELERALFDGSLQVKDLPHEWNRLYKAYLGVDVPDDTRGVLQDIHWSMGSFGYFPTYSVGSAYGAQIYGAMAAEVDVPGALSRGDFGSINSWLGEHIHRHGALLKPADILKNATGAPFDVQHYIDYLKGKYTALYNL